MKVLIIEDDEDIKDTIALTFQVGWPNVELISTSKGEKGIEMVENEAPQLVILDLGLPDISGFQVLQRIRGFSNVPIIILSVMAGEDDMVKGLEWGADDYVVKPFRKMELLARIKAILRRQEATVEESPLLCGPLRYEPATRKFFYQEKEIILTVTESLILHQLMKEAGKIVEHSDLAETVWGDDYPGAKDSLKVHIRHLRKKIGAESGSLQIIETRPGIGYSISLHN